MEVVVNQELGHTGFSMFPNINNDKRGLPADATDNREFQLDNESKVRRLSDKQMYAMTVKVTKAELNTDPPLLLKLNFDPKLYKIFDKSMVELKKR